MRLQRCEQGHIYDADKFRSCPHCSRIDIDAAVADTFGKNQSNIDTEIPKDEQLQEYEQIGLRKTVGMLVCTEGKMYGAGFLLHEGENDIGRASNMDVALIREVTISRKCHACITYNEKNREYTLKVTEGKEEVFCNGTVVNNSCILQHKDELLIGACKLIFIEAESIWR